MDVKDLEGKKLPDLREIAKSLGMKKVESYKKADLIEAIAGQSTQASTDSSETSSDNTSEEKTKRKRVRVKSEDNKEQTELFSKPEDKKPEEKKEETPSEEKGSQENKDNLKPKTEQGSILLKSALAAKQARSEGKSVEE